MAESIVLEETATASVSALGHLRLKRAGLGGFTAVIAQGFGIAVSFVAVPLIVGYLGPERYGLWVTISSFLAWLTISDVGFGSSLVNALAEADALGDRTLAQGLVATAFWTLVVIALGMAFLTALVVPAVDWGRILNASATVSQTEIRWAIWLAFGLFSLSFPASLGTSIYRGYQETHKGNLWTIAGSLLSLGALLAVVHQKAGLPVLVLAVAGTGAAVRIVNLVFLCWFERPWLLPLPGLVRSVHFQRLWKLGAFYLIQQLGNIGMFQIQPIILSRLQGPQAVGTFNVGYKLLTVPQMLLIMLLSPLIGAYGEAQARGHWEWIRRTAVWTTAGSVVLMLITVVPLALLSPFIIPRWASAAMMPDKATILWLGVYVVAAGLATSLAVLLQGLERARDIAYLTISNGIFVIVSSIWLVGKFGPAGIAVAMSVGVIGINCLPQALLAWRQVYQARKPIAGN